MQNLKKRVDVTTTNGTKFEPEKNPKALHCIRPTAVAMIHAFGAAIHQIFMQPVQEKPDEMNGSAGQDNPTQITPKRVCRSLAEQQSTYKPEITYTDKAGVCIHIRRIFFIYFPLSLSLRRSRIVCQMLAHTFSLLTTHTFVQSTYSAGGGGRNLQYLNVLKPKENLIILSAFSNDKGHIILSNKSRINI